MHENAFRSTMSCYKLSSENLTKLFPPLSAKGKHFGQLLVRACTSMSRLRAHVDLTEICSVSLAKSGHGSGVTPCVFLVARLLACAFYGVLDDVRD